MKTPCKLAAFALLSTFSLQPSALLAQGSLTPPGAPAPTMKTLTQIEPRTPIASAPFTISSSGSYYLTTNLTVSSGNAITIATNGVTLDLNGFTLRSTAASGTSSGIWLNSGLRNIAIANGNIEGGVTNNDGTFSGPGFGFGITFTTLAPENVRVANVSVAGCRYYGIYLGNDTSVVENCTVRTVGNHGIFAAIIRGCMAKDCGSIAIFGRQVSDCRGESVDSYGVLSDSALNCYGGSGNSTALSAVTAQNSYGYSSSSGTGLYASAAQNCYGYSDSSIGLYATRTAVGCYGYSSSGTAGLYAQNANTCTGYRSGGTAIQATIATGCYAATGTNNITYKYNMP